MAAFSRPFQLWFPIPAAFAAHFLLRFFADYALLGLFTATVPDQGRLWTAVKALYRSVIVVLGGACIAGMFVRDAVHVSQIFASIRACTFVLYPAISMVVLALAVRSLTRRLWPQSLVYTALALVGFHDLLLGYHYISSIYLTKHVHLLAITACLFTLLRRAATAHAQEKIARQAERDLAHLAQQVDHDIRSPLAALDVIKDDLGDAPEGVRAVIQMAAGRIREIADSLRSSRDAASDSTTEVDHVPSEGPVLLGSLVGAIVYEKRIQYVRSPELDLRLELGNDSHDSFVDGPAGPLKRVFSNLLNNAVEAVNSCGKVCVTVYTDQNRVYATITDDGPGMPASVMARLGQRGATVGKAGGRGLGVSHAIATIRSQGGDVSYQVPPGGGTIVTVALPSVPAPEFVPIESGACLENAV